ncbi:XkdX family protein [Furfurilactobacillus curtus]|uniref:XkdX family protein n=1 Tax=Furfurilactobacillus curtus TaxID=1746200 RepID=A0ABQ5JKW8_9LACO
MMFFDLFKLFYQQWHTMTAADLKVQVSNKVITADQFKEITGDDYVAQTTTE